VFSQTLPAGTGQCCRSRTNPCVQIFVRDVPPKRAVAIQAQHDDLGGEMDRRQWVSLVHPARTFLKVVSLGFLVHLSAAVLVRSRTCSDEYAHAPATAATRARTTAAQR